MKKLFFMCCMMLTLALTAQTSNVIPSDDVGTLQLEEQSVSMDIVMNDLDVLTQDVKLLVNNVIDTSVDTSYDYLFNDVGKQVVNNIIYNNTLQSNSLVNNIITNKNYTSSSGTSDLLDKLITQSKQQYSNIMSRRGLD